MENFISFPVSLQEIVLHIVKHFIAELESGITPEDFFTKGEEYNLTPAESSIVSLILEDLSPRALQQRLNMSEASLLFYLKGVVEKFETPGSV